MCARRWTGSSMSNGVKQPMPDWESPRATIESDQAGSPMASPHGQTGPFVTRARADPVLWTLGWMLWLDCRTRSRCAQPRVQAPLVRVLDLGQRSVGSETARARDLGGCSLRRSLYEAGHRTAAQTTLG